MTAYVFVGPTIGRDEVRAAGIPDLVCLPPVTQGDLYRVAQERPAAIGIVDGYFEGALSVWHKEILWAMAEGIHVFGSASMGALRAAELHGFGMHGVGRIFEAYRDGELEDDDEVAVIHGPPETGYLALSEAMVNIRPTLAAAEAAGIIGAGSRAALFRSAKRRFYQDRSYAHLLGAAADRSVPPDELEALRAWLPGGRVDQKRADALAMLEAMRALLDGRAEPMEVDYVLEWTEMWDDAVATSAASRLTDAEGAAAWLAEDRVLEELRLEADSYRGMRDRALLGLLAQHEAGRRRQTIERAALRHALARFRARHGLFARADLERWLAANGIVHERLEHLLENQARVEAIRSLAEPALRDRLLDELRLCGDYGRLATRGLDKQQRLAARGLDRPEPEDVGVVAAQLLAWYFEGRLARPLPDDIEAAARELGFAGRTDFHRALLREYLYCSGCERAVERDRGN
jgi:hypothetical protein